MAESAFLNDAFVANGYIKIEALGYGLWVSCHKGCLVILSKVFGTISEGFEPTP
jgi:hypothetical protein